MENAIAKAKILMQALPYIKEYKGKTVVIKYGGKAMVLEKLKQSIVNDLALMHYVGLNPVVVHGGGPEISLAMRNAGIEPKFVDGLRLTDKPTMDIVAKVLGQACQRIADNINKHGDVAQAYSGEVIVAYKKQYDKDLGFVGDVQSVDVEKLNKTIKEGKIPVISSVGQGQDGNSYNINADTVAASVAEAIKAEKLIYLTDVDGIYGKIGEKDSLLSVLNIEQSQKLIDDGRLKGGMLPKLLSCIEAIDSGVHRCHILNGTIQHALLLEIFTDEGVGTMVVRG
ncbi:MAG: acetylglutamate kinase [Actinobacteria bacterium]|nr:MAG: acetylglutamate kinase [Actinomycetota bacterium]